MTFCLDTVFVKPKKDTQIQNAIILLHGYGGDGKDISMLTLNWKRHLPNTIFVCPNGHEPCMVNPSGFQWFDLTRDDPKYILEESIKAEKKLKQFIDEIKYEFEKNTPLTNARTNVTEIGDTQKNMATQFNNLPPQMHKGGFLKQTSSIPTIERVGERESLNSQRHRLSKAAFEGFMDKFGN